MTGLQLADGTPMTVVITTGSGDNVIMYPHGVGEGVVIGRAEQLILADWLNARPFPWADDAEHPA